jgi:hypothetical protein
MSGRTRASAPVRWAAMAVIAMLAVSGCGVTLQSSSEPIPPDILPAPISQIPEPSPSITPSPTASETESVTPESRLRLWFVQEDGLAAVESSLPTGSSPEYVMQALVVGPTPEQTALGLRTIASDPLTGLPLATIAAPVPPDEAAPASGPPPTIDPLVPEPITVVLSQAFTALPPAEQVLLLGQVVLSLTGAGESAVAFTDESGATLAVPLPDGRLLDTPARARDYGPLIYRP